MSATQQNYMVTVTYADGEEQTTEFGIGTPGLREAQEFFVKERNERTDNVVSVELWSAFRNIHRFDA